jgi:hypothetical protein
MILSTFLIMAGAVGFFSFKIIQNRSRIERHTPPHDASLYDKWFRQIFLQKFLSNSIKAVNLEHCDLSEFDLTDKFDILLSSNFDTKTMWPDRLPGSFDPVQIMEKGKNPGLKIRSLHRRGITGKGVSIAIIDYPLLTRHKEYQKRLRLYQEINAVHKEAHMHGTHMSSLAVGKNTGTAPESSLYFIGTSNMEARKKGEAKAHLNFSNEAEAINKILEINEGLPEEKKIRVISISACWSSENVGYQEMMEAVNKAKTKGIFVISGNLFETYNHKFFFHGLDRGPMDNPDDFSSYDVIPWDDWMSLLGRSRFPQFIDIYEESVGKDLRGEVLLVPIYSRTMASPAGREVYIFSRSGGWSIVPPYLAGIYALACQVKSDITPKIFWEKALETGERRIIHKDGREIPGKIINPVRLIDSIESAGK